jgi:tetratricopeptide (TPR) repeat protein
MDAQSSAPFDEATRLIAAGRGFEAVPFLETALAQVGDDESRGVIRYHLGFQLERVGEHAKAAGHLRAWLDIDRPRLEPLIGIDPSVTRIVATVLSTLGRCEQKLKQYANAIATFHQALSLWIATAGEDSPNAILGVDDLAYTYELMGDVPAAERLLRRVAELRERTLGSDHPQTRNSRQLLAQLCERDGSSNRPEWDVALDFYVDRFRDVMEAGDQAGAEHLLGTLVQLVSEIPVEKRNEATDALNRLAVDCGARSQAQLQLACAAAAYDISTESYGRDSPATISLASNLAYAYSRAGEFSEAIRLNEECLERRRALHGHDHPDVALSLNNLAQVHQELGEVECALELMQDALRIDQGSYGINHDATAGDLHNIGLAYSGLGDHYRAMSFLSRAVVIWRELHPSGHIHLGIALKNLGSSYAAVGDFAAAMRYQDMAYVMLQKTAGEAHPATIAAKASLEHLRTQLFDRDTDRNSLISTVGEAQTRLGRTHPDVLRLRMRALASGSPTAEEVDAALSDVVGVFGGDSPDALSLIEMKGESLARQNDFGGAAAAFRHVLSHTLSDAPGSIRTSRLYLRLAAAETAAADLPSAVAHVRESERHLRIACTRLPFTASESQWDGVTRATAQLISHAFSLWTDHMPRSREVRDLALQIALSYKSLSSDLIERERRAARDDQRPPVQAKFAELRQLRQNVINEIIIAPTSRGALFSTEDIKRWQVQQRVVGGELAELLRNGDWQLGSATELCDAISSRLPKRSGLIEFVQFEHVDFGFWVGNTSSGLEAARYILDPPRIVAFLLRPGIPAQSAVLGSSADIGIHVDDLARLSNPARMDDEPCVRGRKQIRVPSSWREAAEALRQVLLDPLDGLWDCDEIFIAPDGETGALGFEMLPDPRGGSLLEHRLITYVATGREILARSDRGRPMSSPPVVIADPAFDVLDDKRCISAETLDAYGLAIASTAIEQQMRYFAPLSGTVAEGRAIARLLGVDAWVGTSANKSAIVSLHSPHVLHVATHGFFPEECNAQLAAAAEHFDLALAKEMIMEPSWSLNSGIALAGANWKASLAERLVEVGSVFGESREPLDSTAPHAEKESVGSFAEARPLLAGFEKNAVMDSGDKRWRRLPEIKLMQRLASEGIQYIQGEAAGDDGARGKRIRAEFGLFLPPEHMGDGLMTAEDVGWLDLAGTELVVLSACGSGRGIHSTGDGMFGLRRAFFVAGARTVVCSLWNVPDDETTALMLDFYRFLLTGAGCSEALRKAKQIMQCKFPDQPFYWAAFVCYGHPGPLSFGPEEAASRM